jgi:elongation factor Ts
VLVGYVHNRVDNAVAAGTAAAVVELVPLKEAVTEETLQTAGKKLAMHIVASRPAYLTVADVPADVLDKEKEILTKQIGDSGKPAAIVEKIVQGKLRKFYESVCLTEQAHMIEEGNPNIAKCLAEQGIAVKRFEALSIS